MIDQIEMMRVVEKLRSDAVVMSVFRANVAWTQVTHNPKRDVPVGTYEFPAAMGIASSLALGLCLARPGTKVIVFDGDGSLLMNLGSLVTIANKAPKNLYHFVMDNGVYATTGGQDVPAAGRVSYSEMARAAGYAYSFEFDDLEEFSGRSEEVLSQEGPVLVCIKSVPDIRPPQERRVVRRVVRRAEVPPQAPEAIRNLLEEFGGEA